MLCVTRLSVVCVAVGIMKENDRCTKLVPLQASEQFVIMLGVFRRKVVPSGYRGAFSVIAGSRGLAGEGPSETTTVLLKKLHPSATQKSLSDLIATSTMRIRRVHIEPGCAVHLSNVVQAECAIKILEQKYSLRVIPAKYVFLLRS